MILVSNHLLRLDSIDIKPDNVIRINCAWVDGAAGLEKALDIPYRVFVDYPTGRTKPPAPRLTLDEAIGIANRHSNVEFFAVSNAEDVDELFEIGLKLNSRIDLVPKIETKQGVFGIDEIVGAAGCSHIMLDKEDLWENAQRSATVYDGLMQSVREYCKDNEVAIFELSGVIFDDGQQ